MGRIVIPRVRQEARQQLQRKRRTGYFANGFGPQEMKLVMQLADLAVAGGGQIARAVQISNREKEQAEAQADYDRKIQANAEERRAAAQGLVDATDIDGQVEAFFAQQEPPSVRERLPSMPSMSFQSDLVQPRPMQRGGGVLARPGLLAPEDVTRMEQQRGQLAGADRSMDLDLPGNPMDIALNAMNVFRNAKRMADETNIIRPAQTARDIATRMDNAYADLNRAASIAVAAGDLQAQQVAMRGLAEMTAGTPLSPNYGDTTQAGQLLARADQGVDMAMTPEERATAMAAMPTLPAASPAGLQFQNRFSAADEYGSMQRRAAREQEMQSRDFRQEAIEAAGPAPERKLFRIADILAAAPSARTAEQRAMLLQAASDSPDIQAANLTDLARGAYRDRAMQAVMKLFPEEEEALSELDMLRMQSMRESMETENLRQKKLQAELNKADRKLKSSGRRSGGSDKAVLDNLRAHRRFYNDLQEGTGQFSATAIAARLDSRLGQTGSYDESDISAERARLWNALAGPLSGDDQTSVELNARSLLRSKRARKDASDTADDIAKASKEARIAAQNKQRIDLSERRATSVEQSKAKQYNLSVQRLLSSTQAKAAKAKYSKDVLEGMDEADAVKLYSATLDDIHGRASGEATRDNPIVIKDEVIDID